MKRIGLMDKYLSLIEDGKAAGLEALADGTARVERERAFLMKLEDFSWMNKVESKEFITAELRSEFDDDDDDEDVVRGSIRARKEGNDYRLVVKKFDHEGSHPLESELAITKDFFDILFMLAPIQTRKERHFIPVKGHEGLFWEVDIYPHDEPDLYGWVKVDFEYPEDFDGDELPEFPFAYSEMIDLADQSETEKEFVEDFFDRTNIFNVNSMLPIECGEDDDDDEDEGQEEQEESDSTDIEVEESDDVL